MTRAALVLGAAVRADGTPSATLARRADHALALWRAGAVDVLVGCGGVGVHPPAEGQVMADRWRAAGVPDAAIRVEGQSTTTRENVTLALPILRALGAESVVIVTDPYHAVRARLIARQAGLRVRVACPRWRAVGPRQWAIHLPREALALVAVALRWR